MTYAGARGETAAQMKRALRLTSADDAIHAEYKARLAEWNTGKKPYDMAIANRLYGEKTLSFRKEFVGLTDQAYGAKLVSSDFMGNSETERLGINQWVSEKTKNRINGLLPRGSLNFRTRLVLVNAIYFKGKWEREFDKKATRDEPFVAHGGSKNVPTMHALQDVGYVERDGVKVVELPYKGGELSMVIVLPDTKDGLDAIAGRLSRQTLTTWLGALAPMPVSLSIPRFKMSPAPILLNAQMSELGMVDAFDETKADFSGISDRAITAEGRFFLTFAVHKAFIEVNEEGTEAAAATVVGGPTSVPPPPKVFKADHPFLFVLRDRKSGAILFMGRVNDPASQG